jgi:MFS family permease
MNLECEDHLTISYIGSSYFVGMLIALIAFPRLSDLYGRKWIFYGEVLVNLISFNYVLFIASTSSELIWNILILGFSTGIRLSVSFVFVIESVPKEWQVFCSTLWCVMEGAVTSEATFFFQVISSDWRVFGAFNSLCALVSVVLTYMWVVESPIFAYNLHDYDLSRELFKKVAKVNRVKNLELFDNLTFDKEELDYHSPDKKHRPSFRSQLTPRSIRNLLVMPVLWVCSCFGNYMIVFYLKYVPGSIFQLSYASSFGEIIFYGTSLQILKRIGLKKTFLTGYTIQVLGSMALIMMNDHKTSILSPMFIFLCKAGTCLTFAVCFSGNPRLFPPGIAATCLGICNVFSRGITILSPVVAEIPAPVPMGVFLGSSLLALILCSFL